MHIVSTILFWLGVGCLGLAALQIVIALFYLLCGKTPVYNAIKAEQCVDACQRLSIWALVILLISKLLA